MHTLIITLLSTFASLYSQLHSGDLIFEIATPDNEMSKAIVNATAATDSLQFSHVGIISFDSDGEPVVIEATGKDGVVITPMASFMQKAQAGAVVKRLDIEYPVNETLKRAHSFLGRGYDWWYLPDNEEIYCSELVEKCYLNYNGSPIFSTIPMNFRNPDGTMPQFWTTLFDRLNRPVPEGMPGTNPSQISHNEHLTTVCFIPPDTTSPTTVALNEVSVTGKQWNNARQSISQTPVYNRTAMSSAPVQTIEGALKLSPAVDVRERGGKGVQTDFLVRGGSFDQSMVLLNGINFTDPRTGHQSHSLPVDIDIVSNISVIDGVTGVGAYSGAVDIVTAPLRSRYLSAQLSGGRHDYLYGNMHGNYSSEHFSVMAMGSVRHSGGYIHNTDFTNYNAYANARYHSRRVGTIQAQAGYQHRSFGANGFYSRKYPDQYETTSTALGSIKWQHTLNRLSLRANFNYRYNTDCYELIKNDESLVPFNHHITYNTGAALGASYDWLKAGETSIDIDLTRNKILSTVLGEPCKPHIIDGISYNHKKTRTIINAIARHSVTFNTLTVMAAAGLSHSNYGNDALWSFGLNYGLNDSWRVGGGVVESMRLPTFTDLYYTSTGYESDRNLVPEHATTYNLSANYSHGNWSANAYAYYRHGRNVIDWIKPEGSDNWHSMQITQINTCGVELTGAYTTSTWLRRVALSYGHITQSSRSGKNVISAIAFDYLRNKASFILDIAPIKRFTISATGTLFDRIGNYIDGSGNVHAYSPFFLLDAKITYTQSWWQLYIEDTNLTGTRYYDYGGLKMPGSWLSGGLIITI